MRSIGFSRTFFPSGFPLFFISSTRYILLCTVIVVSDIRTSGEELIEGLVVTQVQKNGEAVFVNIVGDINLETISRLGSKFDIPGIDDLHGHEGHDRSEKDSQN